MCVMVEPAPQMAWIVEMVLRGLKKSMQGRVAGEPGTKE
jgi:hypothetical protein